ncbi:MAG: amidohydrolase [Deltaproteobacteria bacterium]|nr:amidohydrolase [Deltaproteobacteria bacterium]
MNIHHEKPDILITGGMLLTMEPPGEIVQEPVIGIRDGKIDFIEKGNNLFGHYKEASEVIDASGCIVMPGLVNAHAHLAMTCFRGLADDLPLMPWLNDHIFPAEARFIDRKTVYAGAMLAIAEMILSGTTTFCDGYFFEGEVGRAAIVAGMRGVIAKGFLDFPMPDQPGHSDKAAIAERFVERWRDRSPLITPALICHSPYTCSPDTLQTVKAVARRAGVSFQIHLSETREEVRMIRERYGMKPVQHLRNLDLLDGDTIAAHCIWLDAAELDLLAAGKVKVVHDPESNMKLGAGVAPVLEMLRRGIDVGLGTDGCASNNDLDLFGEMGMAAKLHKVFSGDPTALTAERVVEMATIGGARVLGMADRIGSIAPGKQADIILVDMRKPHLTPLYHPFSHLVYAARGADVITSIIGGRIVMKERRLLQIDPASIMEEVRRIASRISEAGFHHAAGHFNADSR